MPKTVIVDSEMNAHFCIIKTRKGKKYMKNITTPSATTKNGTANERWSKAISRPVMKTTMISFGNMACSLSMFQDNERNRKTGPEIQDGFAADTRSVLPCTAWM